MKLVFRISEDGSETVLLCCSTIVQHCGNFWKESDKTCAVHFYFCGDNARIFILCKTKRDFWLGFPAVYMFSSIPKTVMTLRDAGTGGQEGQPPPLPFTRRGKGGKGALSMPWRNSELPEMLVQFFYEFASENARNAVIELQE